MSKYVCMGAQLQCSFGMNPSALMVVVPLRPMIQNKLVANISDCIPMVNIMPFGMCKSMANPTVASATAAACGTLTPMPCIPVPAGTWMPGGKPMVMNMPALLDNCKLICAWGGQITVKDPGNTAQIDAK